MENRPKHANLDQIPQSRSRSWFRLVKLERLLMYLRNTLLNYMTQWYDFMHANESIFLKEKKKTLKRQLNLILSPVILKGCEHHG